MSTEKVSLSLDRDLVAEARDLAGRGGLSALINEGLRLRLQQLRVARLLDEMDEEYGPVPAEVAQEVTGAWRETDQEAAG